MVLILGNAPIPAQDRIARGRRSAFGDRPDPQEGLITDPWNDYLTRLAATVNASPARINSVSLEEQAASIAATDFAGVVLSAGLYRVTFSAWITQAASVSSSLTVQIDFTHESVSKGFNGGAMTGNTTATWQSETVLLHVDGASPIRYSTTYVSVGGTPMKYALDLTLEVVRA